MDRERSLADYSPWSHSQTRLSDFHITIHGGEPLKFVNHCCTPVIYIAHELYFNLKNGEKERKRTIIRSRHPLKKKKKN